MSTLTKRCIATCALLSVFSFASFADETISEAFKKFTAIYQAELGNGEICEQTAIKIKVCSSALRNNGNAPFILHHGKPTNNVYVLFHGLSDSPFFMRSLAEKIHSSGNNVVVALLPGHGKKDADEDMEDSDLQTRWQTHVREVMEFADGIGVKRFIGGFSTGGGLASHYVLSNPGEAFGLLLFSGALELGGPIESIDGIWGMKLLVKILDGEYQTDGPNPYKYPGVAKYAAFVLMDVINEVREMLEAGHELNVPVFVAHSMADTTTLFSGVENLIAHNDDNTVFAIDEKFDVCHADLVVNQQQIDEIAFDESKLENEEKCSIPKANPQHAFMLEALNAFVIENQ